MKIYDSVELRKWDAYTIEHEPISSIKLMERASLLCAKHILSRHGIKNFTIVCGIGNNGGDGLAIARILAKSGCEIEVVILQYSNEQTEDFNLNLARLPKSIPVTWLSKTSHTFNFKDKCVIDCIFGTGLNRPLTGWLKAVVQQINDDSRFAISIDIPSGLFPVDNTGNDLEAIVRAHETLSLQCPKMCFFYQRYAQFVGEFAVIDIQLAEDYSEPVVADYLTTKHIVLKTPNQFAHKGDNGYLMLIGGLEHMGGAIMLSTKAAFRAGCGYVGVRSNEDHYGRMLKVIPEALFIKEDAIPDKATAIAIGPGLSQTKEAKHLLFKAFESNIPLVIDADAINIMVKEGLTPPKNTILTPHLGELKGLLGDWDSPEECLKKQRTYAVKHQVYVLQKGAYSKICTAEGKVLVNSTGNKNMAKAGMGDTLTGIIGSFLAQGYAALDAIKAGVFLHGLAGDLAAETFGTSLISSDVIEAIPDALKKINNSNDERAN